MLDRINKNAAFNASEQLIFADLSGFNISCGHAHDRFKFEADGTGIPGYCFIEIGCRNAAVQASAQNALFDERSSFRPGAFVVKWRKTATGEVAIVDDAEMFRANFFAELPFLEHGSIADHEVGFALVAKAFVCKNARCQRR
jgi:hypothetical protein